MSDRMGDRERDMLYGMERREWPQIAEVMNWDPTTETPSWMDPSERAWFWREVAEVNRQALVDRAMARIRADMESAFHPTLLRLAAALGRMSAVGSAVKRRLGLRR